MVPMATTLNNLILKFRRNRPIWQVILEVLFVTFVY